MSATASPDNDSATIPIRGAQAIVRAMDILLSFSREHPSRSLSDLAGELGLALSTTHRIATALESRGLLVQAKRGKEFTLGPAILRMANVVIDQYDLAGATRASLERLRRQTGETASVHRKVGGERVCLMELPSTYEIKITSGIGKSYPLYAGAAGKAILSLMTDTAVDRLFAEWRPSATGDPLRPEMLRDEIREIQRRGYATSAGESIRGATAVAVPLRTDDPDSPAAILVTGPTERLPSDALKAVAAMILDEAAIINRSAL